MRRRSLARVRVKGIRIKPLIFPRFPIQEQGNNRAEQADRPWFAALAALARARWDRGW
jgi:hypothetical protein